MKSEFGLACHQGRGQASEDLPPFDQVKDQVARYVGQKAQSDEIMKLRQEAKIERMTPSPAPTPAPGCRAGSGRGARVARAADATPKP